jgi:hypothetical protein
MTRPTTPANKNIKNKKKKKEKKRFKFVTKIYVCTYEASLNETTLHYSLDDTR